jgi:hypothetical protein
LREKEREITKQYEEIWNLKKQTDKKAKENGRIKEINMQREKEILNFTLRHVCRYFVSKI